MVEDYQNRAPVTTKQVSEYKGYGFHKIEWSRTSPRGERVEVVVLKDGKRVVFNTDLSPGDPLTNKVRDLLINQFEKQEVDNL